MTVAGQNIAPAARPAAVAGFFYPADATELTAILDDMSQQARRQMPIPSSTSPKAIVAPHAGYVYSGQIAAQAYHHLTGSKDRIQRVILAAPAHRQAFKGVALPTQERFDTPLGSVALDQEAMKRLQQEPDVLLSDSAHAQEHAIEVHLPFLQHMLGSDFTLVPLLVGGIDPTRLAAIYDMLWGGDETVFVISSDLSHYLDYEAARRIDLETCHAVEMLRPDLISDAGACGRIPLKAMLVKAQQQDLRATTLALQNSGDTAGNKERVVGYGAWAFEDNLTARMDDHHRRELLNTAAKAIQMGLRSGGRIPQVDEMSFALPLRSFRASFITLEISGKLRGCIGSLAAHQSLVSDVVANSIKAAFKDPRFPPLQQTEFADLNIGISVLGANSPLQFDNEADLLQQLRPRIDGLILEDGGKRGLFLPQVWDSLPDTAQFLAHLKQKAGLPANHWSPALTIQRFTVEKFAADCRDLEIAT